MVHKNIIMFYQSPIKSILFSLNQKKGIVTSLCFLLFWTLLFPNSGDYSKRNQQQVNSIQQTKSLIERKALSKKQVYDLLSKIEDYKFKDPILVNQVVKTCLEWSEIHRNKLVRAKSLFWLGWIQMQQINRGEEIANVQASAEISRRLLEDLGNAFWLARVQDLLATIYAYQSKYDTAYAILNAAKQNISKIKNNQLDSIFILAETYNTESIILAELMESTTLEVIELLVKSAELFRKLNLPNERARAYNNMAGHYQNLGLLAEAKNAALNAYMLKDQIENQELSTTFFRLGRVYLWEYDSIPYDSNLLTKGIKYLKKSLQTSSLNACISCQFLARGYYKKNPYDYQSEDRDSAYVYLKNAINYAIEHNNINCLHRLLLNINAIFEGENRWDLLKEYSKANMIINKAGKESLYAASERLTNYSLEELNKANKLRQRKIIISTAIGVLVLLIAGTIYHYHQKFKALHRELEAKAAAARAHINPHFIANALNAIDGLIEKGQYRKASKYLTRFARLSRVVLHNARQPIVLLKDEITLLEDYLALEKLRFSDHLSYNIEIADVLLSKKYSFPSMIIQPIVENSIKHGISHKLTPGNIKVHFKLIGEKKLECIVQDDGVGRDKAKKFKQTLIDNREGMGQEIIDDRLKTLKRQGHPANLRIIDLYDEFQNPIGTRVEVELPIIEKVNK